MHPSGRLHDGDLVSDHRGLDGGSSQVNRHVLDEKTNPTEIEANRFADELIARLESGHREQRFDSLVLIAPPHFLGRLRSKLSKTLSSIVEQQIDKNLVRAPAATVRANLTRISPIQSESTTEFP